MTYEFRSNGIYDLFTAEVSLQTKDRTELAVKDTFEDYKSTVYVPFIIEAVFVREWEFILTFADVAVVFAIEFNVEFAGNVFEFKYPTVTTPELSSPVGFAHPVIV